MTDPLDPKATAAGSLVDVVAPSAALGRGLTLGPFFLGEKCGQGAMGVVYAARDLRDGRPVAVKVLPAALVADLGRARRFAAEAEVLASLDHPAIVRHIAHGTTPRGEAFLAMEWLDGEDLARTLERRGLGVREVVALGQRVAEGLAAAHARGVVHRDIKPSNLFLRGGEAAGAVILDFGIARVEAATAALTATGALVGTPAYMAPEQAGGASSIDARADLFSLGAVLFECLAGRPAFTGTHPMAVLAKVLLEEPPRLATLRAGVPPELDDLVALLLAKDPAARPVSAAAVADALARMSLDDAGPEVAPAQPGPHVALTAGEQRFLCVVLAVMPGAESRDLSRSSARGSADTLHAASKGLLASLESAVARLGAEAVRLLNGSVLVTSKSAGGAADRAVRAAWCALVIRSLVPGATVAIATGLGDASAPVPVGQVLDRAASLVRAHDAGEGVWVDDVTAGLLDGRFVVREGPDARELLHERGVGESARLLLGRPSPCVGRERELRLLGDVLDECIAEGVARAVLVKAPAGAGKSRLLCEMLAQAPRRHDGLAVWLGRADMQSAGSAYALLASALRHATGIREGEPLGLRRQKLAQRVVRNVATRDQARVTAFLGELTATPFPDDELPLLHSARRDPSLFGEQARRAFEDFVAAECAAGPVLVVLEDVHWGDVPSFKLIDAALGRAKDRPLAVVAAGRPEVDDLFPKLWADRDVQELRLAELTRRAAERLVRHTLGERVSADTLGRVVERAAGNAFYLEELIRAVAEGRAQELPETVLAMVQARLDALSPDDRRLLRAASVFGETFWRGGVLALLGAERSASVGARLDALVDAEVFVRREESRFPAEDELGFRHALLRDGAYAALTEHDRAVGHGLAAAWLEARGEGDPLVLAEHFERGGEPARAAVQHLRAAAKAYSGGDPAAIARADRGLACGARGEVRFSLLGIRGRAQWMIGDQKGVEASCAELRREVSPAHPIYSTLLVARLVTAAQRGDEPALLQTVAATRDLVPSGDNVGTLAELLWAVFTRLPHLCDERLRERAAQVAGLVSPRDRMAVGYLTATRASAAATFDGDLSRAAALHVEAAAHVEAAGNVVVGARMRSSAGTLLGALGAYVRSAEQHGLALAQTGGVGTQGWIVRVARAFSLVEHGCHRGSAGGGRTPGARGGGTGRSGVRGVESAARGWRTSSLR